jgi:DNA-binding NtrC family response regulator
MLGPGRIHVHCAQTLEMADFLLLASGATVLVVDTNFLDGSWRDALEMMRGVHPVVATVICAEPADRDCLACAKELGALDVLRRPIGLERLRSSIRGAHEVTVERMGWLREKSAEPIQRLARL